VGEKAAFVLSQRFRTLDALASAQAEDLDTIYEVGQIMAKSVVDYFAQTHTKRLIQELKKAGVNPKEEARQIRNAQLTGKAIVFTGELKEFSRQRAEELVRSVGGNAVSSVSKNTDFVVAGDNPGSKFEKAKKLGVKIINEKTFMEMLS
jgi:DNA ligase (NAD+)